MYREAQKSYVIHNYYDLIRALKENPEWLEELRKLILTHDLLELPKKFEEFLEKEFRPLKSDVETLKKDVETLKSDVETLKKDVEILKRDVGVLKVDVANLKGDNFERKVRERAPAFFGKHFKKVKVIPIEEWADKLDETQEAGIISSEERKEALNLDLLIRCKRWEDTEEILLAVEASYTADDKDAVRALKRAEIFFKVYQIKTIPVVIAKELSPFLEEKYPEVLFIRVEAE
ncbi:MAG: hypothetical protein NZ530_03885 [Thermodesulfobacteriaceae bacterium]|nr:hypothetical protein [Thermodesulfobacteriaceae bacterium]